MLTAREKFFIASKRQKARIDSERKRREKKEAKFHSGGGWDLAQVPEGCLTLKQAADKYNRAPSGIHKAIAIGKLESMKIGPYRVIKESDLVAYFSAVTESKKASAYRAMCIRTGRPIPT